MKNQIVPSPISTRYQFLPPLRWGLIPTPYCTIAVAIGNGPTVCKTYLDLYLSLENFDNKTGHQTLTPKLTLGTQTIPKSYTDQRLLTCIQVAPPKVGTRLVALGLRLMELLHALLATSY